MKKFIHLLILPAAFVFLGLAAPNAVAQPNFGGDNGGGGGGNFGGGGGNFGGRGGNFGNGNFDPQQMQQQFQQRLLDNLRQQLEITNDAEWGAIQPLILKVGQDWMSSMLGGSLGGLQNMFGNRGGGGRGGQGRGIASLLSGQQPDPTADALRNAIDANAPTEQLKAAMDRYRVAKKAKADELEKNREELRQVLTIRQEAILVSMGILD